MSEFDPQKFNPEMFPPEVQEKVYSELYPDIDPRFTETPLLMNFTHWLLFPETDDYYPFIKAVAFDSRTTQSSKDKFKDQKIQIFSISNRPQGYPTRPEYKPKYIKQRLEAEKKKLELAFLNSQ